MPELIAIGRYNKQAKRFSRMGRTSDALINLANAMRLAREVDRPKLEAMSKRTMGKIYQQVGRHDLAVHCLRIALDLAQRNCHSDHPLCRLITRDLEQSIEQGRAA